MSKRATNNFYKIYPKYWKLYSKELRKSKSCYFKDKTCKGKLTLAHIDQNPKNNKQENVKVLCTSHHIRLDQPFHCFSMSSNKKTDNSYLNEKIELRIDSIKHLKKVIVLEVYSGSGLIWNEVKKKTKKQIDILKIEKKENKKGVYLQGDNNKFIPLFDFSNYDVIDLDSYGVPFQQLKAIFQKEYKGIVHCTFIQSGMGRLPNELLQEIGYSKQMIKKCPIILCKNGLEKMQNYLSKKGIKEITGYFNNRKNYFYFQTNGCNI